MSVAWSLRLRCLPLTLGRAGVIRLMMPECSQYPQSEKSII
jgi:hypothetical protein